MPGHPLFRGRTLDKPTREERGARHAARTSDPSPEGTSYLARLLEMLSTPGAEEELAPSSEQHVVAIDLDLEERKAIFLTKIESRPAGIYLAFRAAGTAPSRHGDLGPQGDPRKNP